MAQNEPIKLRWEVMERTHEAGAQHSFAVSIEGGQEESDEPDEGGLAFRRRFPT
jgi:hypothetical protein